MSEYERLNSDDGCAAAPLDVFARADGQGQGGRAWVAVGPQPGLYGLRGNGCEPHAFATDHHGLGHGEIGDRGEQTAKAAACVVDDPPSRRFA